MTAIEGRKTPIDEAVDYYINKALERGGYE